MLLFLTTTYVLWLNVTSVLSMTLGGPLMIRPTEGLIEPLISIRLIAVAAVLQTGVTK